LGTCSLMLRENSKWWTHKDESIDAMSRGGTIRSSGEASVMEVERRDCVIQFLTCGQPWQQGRNHWDKTRPLGAWIMGAG
jgi:hypothetical protein